MKNLEKVILGLSLTLGSGCSSPKSYICQKEQIKFDDGDSFFCGNTYIRCLGFDTPEVIHYEHGISINQPFGPEAKNYTNQLLNEAMNIRIFEMGKDEYDRPLAHVLVDGELLGIKLIQGRLAYETISVYGPQSFPEFAIQITDAYAKATSEEPLPFENPHDWREKNQVKKVK